MFRRSSLPNRHAGRSLRGQIATTGFNAEGFRAVCGAKALYCFHSYQASVGASPRNQADFIISAKHCHDLEKASCEALQIIMRGQPGHRWSVIGALALTACLQNRANQFAFGCHCARSSGTPCDGMRNRCGRPNRAAFLAVWIIVFAHSVGVLLFSATRLCRGSVRHGGILQFWYLGGAASARHIDQRSL